MDHGLKQLEDLKRAMPLRFSVSDPVYFYAFEPHLDWWLALWELLLDISQWPAKASSLDELSGHQAVAWRLVADVMPRYTRARTQFHTTGAAGASTAIDLDLLRSYHRMTRFLCGFASKAWPGANLDWLRELA